MKFCFTKKSIPTFNHFLASPIFLIAIQDYQQKIIIQISIQIGKNELHVYRFHWVVFCLFSVILFRPLSQAVPLMHLTSKRFCNLARVSRRVWSTLHCSTEYLISLNCLIWYWTYYFVNWSLTVLKCPFLRALRKRAKRAENKIRVK